MYKVLIGWLALGWFVAGSANATDEIVIADVRACAAIVDPVARDDHDSSSTERPRVYAHVERSPRLGLALRPEKAWPE